MLAFYGFLIAGVFIFIWAIVISTRLGQINDRLKENNRLLQESLQPKKGE